jgi:hypothetical protein
MRNIVIRNGRSHLQIAFSHCNRIEAVKQPPIIIDRCSHLLIAKLRQYLLCGHFGFSHFALCQMSEPKKLFFIGPALKNPVGV